MIAFRLIFQSLASTSVVAGSVWAVVYKMPYSDKNIAPKAPKHYFLLVSGVKSNDLPAKDLWVEPTLQSAATETEAKKLTEKNYICKFSATNTRDNDCEIYSIPVENEKTAIDLSQLQKGLQEKKKVMKAEFESESFFLLKVASSLRRNWTFEEKRTIELVSKESTPKTHSTLTLLASISGSKLTGKTKHAIAKVTSQTFTNENVGATFTCTKKITTSPCSVIELDPFADKSLTQITYNTKTIPASHTASLKLTKLNYYLISWNETEQHSFSDLQNKEVIFKEVSDVKGSENVKNTTLTIEAPVFLIQKLTNAISKVAILK